MRQQEINLEADLRNDKVGQHIQDLERDIETLIQQKQKKEKQAAKYNTAARQLGLPEYDDRVTFDATLRQVPDLLAVAASNETEYMRQRDEHVQKLAELLKLCQSAEAELQSLRGRKSQIPSQDIAIRELLTGALRISEEDLPFVGELVRVRSSEQRWEGAIERLLRGFGRRLLVPEEHYERVSRYVDRVNLHGHLVYSRVPTNGVRQGARQPHQQMLAAKLEVRPETPFSDWLTHELITTYDYLCCETIEEFQQARRALSLQGQMKHSLDRHEKDDRVALNDRTKYILGWNNTEKLAAIEADLAQRRKQHQRVDADKKRLEALIGQEQEQQRLLGQLRNFDDFTSLDWHSDIEQLHDLGRRKQELEQSADHLVDLRRQRAEVADQLKQGENLPFLRSWVQKERFFPCSLPVGSLPLSNYAQLREGVQLLIAESKEQRGYGYTLEFEEHRTRKYERQNLPKRVIIETEYDFLRLIAKEQEFADFEQDVFLLLEQQPSLHAWIVAHPQRVIDYHGHWPALLGVCAYFLEHPRPRCYIRELPIRVHTKFVEQHTGILRELLDTLLPPQAIQPEAKTFAQRFGLREDEPLMRARLLDNQLFKRYGLPVTDLCVPHSQFTLLDLQTERCIVTENKMVFLTLPAFPHTFAIFGEGFTVRSLRTISWLANCPLFYWGDLDAHGFQILSLLRETFPHVISVMMDEQTLQTFSDYCVEGTPCPAHHLPHLTSEEQALFQYLARENIRLEQEHIDYAYASVHLRQCLGES